MTLDQLLAAIAALPTMRASEIDGEESDGTPRHYRNRPYVSRTMLERLLREHWPAATPKSPEGFRLLPEEATDSMVDADWNVSMSEAHSSGGVAAAAWRAMVEAAPQVTYGNGHSGLGWYMHDTEYPEEGAVFLSDGVAVDRHQTK